MNLRRLAVYVALLVALAVLGLGLVYGALGACAPPPLPGDELWSARQNFGEALRLIATLGSTSCFTGYPGAASALWLGGHVMGVLLVLLALIVLWETLGRELRLRWFAARGGHVLLAGLADDLAGLARQQGHFAGTFYLAPDRAAASDIARLRPFAEIRPIARHPASQLARLGAPTARLVAATTRHDLANVAIAEAALDRPGSGELLLRLEQSAVRALSSDPLRRRAEKLGRSLAVVSLTHMQTRRGMAAAMSGRYTIAGAPRVHIALCGTGERLQAVALEIARQGFGLETERPLLSILRTGNADFAAGVLERLQATEAAEVRVATAAMSAGGLDTAITGIVLDAPPLLAIHCVGDTPEEAEAFALRCEEVLQRLGQPVPPIVAYGSLDRPLGSTGMVRVAAEPDLAEARQLSHLMDRRARAVHELFLAAQRAARGAAFGTAPAEADWPHLPEAFRDDNRNVADQMDFKLACIFLLSRAGETGVLLSPGEIEQLATLAHSRWWAAKALAGWRFGPQRDDRAQLHPDMLPYDQLDEPAKQKDRDEVASLAPMADLAGEALQRERRIAIAQPLDVAALAKNLATTPKDAVPVAVLPLHTIDLLEVARALVNRGIAIEAIVDAGTDALRRDDAIAPALAEILRRAWRIHVAPDAAAALRGRATEVANAKGEIDALA